MGKYLYSRLDAVVDSCGKEVEGRMRAPDSRAAATRGAEGRIGVADSRVDTASLEAQRRPVTSLRESSPVLQSSLLDYLSFVRSKDTVMLFRQLSSLFAAGLTLVNALYVLEKQARKRKLRKILQQIRRDIEGGLSFSQALSKHPRIFKPIQIGMAEAGEASGTLDVMLERISNDLEAQATFRSEVISSFIYPSVVVVTSIAVICFLVGYVLPKFIPIIKMAGEDLPWNTQLLITATEWSKKFGRYLAGGVTGTALLLVCIYKFISPARYWIDRLKLKLPVVGPTFLYSLVIRFSRNLSSLVGSGVSMLDSLRRVRRTVGNRAAERVIGVMERRITRGESLSAPLRSATHVFPPMVAEMVAVGEETGKMDSSLELVASIHEKMLQTYIKRMNAMVEPAMILILGSAVGFVAWSFISGALAMYGKVGR
ncbi:MAG: type II secretion system F family protein [Deltaproteobacteria bacterium]|nr:type II secretion system F family protein [Deltaproteobacteria bacterium]